MPRPPPTEPPIRRRSSTVFSSLLLPRRCGWPPLRALDDARDVGSEFLRVVDDAILDRVLDAADALDLAVLIVQLDRAGRIEHLEILERILIDDDHVGEEARPDDPEIDRLA